MVVWNQVIQALDKLKQLALFLPRFKKEENKDIEIMS